MIEVVGHGGAGDFYPGNSRKSIEKALKLGVDRIEIDVLMAGDQTLVLLHDEHVILHGRKTHIREMRLSDLQEAVDGLLTLDEAISLIKGRALLMVDLKTTGYERPVAAALSRAGVAKGSIVSSTYASSLRTIRKYEAAVAIGLSTGHISTVMKRNVLVTVLSKVVSLVSPLPIIAVAKLVRAEHLMLNYRICTPLFVRLAKQAGLGVYPWTVNHPKHIRKMIGMDVAGVISNRPDLVQEALEESPPPVG